MKKKEEIFKRFEKYQKKYEDLLLQMHKLRSFEQDFKNFSNNLNDLKEYYHTQWLEDINTVKNEKETATYPITSEDAIWNLLTEHFQYQKKMLKILVDELNR